MTVNEKAAAELVKSYNDSKIITFASNLKLPDKSEIISILNDLQGLFSLLILQPLILRSVHRTLQSKE